MEEREEEREEEKEERKEEEREERGKEGRNLTFQCKNVSQNDFKQHLNRHFLSMNLFIAPSNFGKKKCHVQILRKRDNRKR